MELTAAEITRLNNARMLAASVGGFAAFAERISRGTPQVQNTIGKNANRAIGPKLARHIEACFGKEPGWLDLPQWAHEKVRAYEVRMVEGDGDHDAERESLVAEVEVYLSAGDGAQAPEYVETKFRMPFQNYWFQRFGARPEDVRLMKVRGSSMEPTLYDGDRVAIHCAEQDPRSEHVYAIILDGEVLIKRLFRERGGLRISSDNSDKTRYPDQIINADEVADRLYVVGRAIDRSGSGGL